MKYFRAWLCEELVKLAIWVCPEDYIPIYVERNLLLIEEIRGLQQKIKMLEAADDGAR